MKKLLALALALAMVFSLMACGTKDESTAVQETSAAAEEKKTEAATSAAAAATTAAAETTAAPSWKEEHPTWLCEEKTTLKVYTYDVVNSTFLPPSNDLYFWQWLEDYTNVHIEWEVVPYTDYKTLVTARMVSGTDLPDIVMMDKNPTLAKDCGDNGLIIDLAPLWDEYCPHLQTYMDNLGMNYKGAISNEDGSMYFLVGVAAPIENRVNLMFNKQWMDELGLEIPTTVAELTDVMYKMQAAGDLNKNGKADEIIFTSSDVDVMQSALNNAWNLEALEEQVRYAADSSGKVFGEYTCDNQKAQLEWLNKLYEDGILDAEITVNSADALSEKIASDRVGIFAYWPAFASTYGNLTTAGQANPNQEYYTLGVPMTSEYNDTPHFVQYESYNRFTGVTRDCKTPELAVAWLDTLLAEDKVLEVRCCGKEGETYYLDENGDPQIILAEDGSWNIKPLGCGQLSLPHIQTELQLLFNKKATIPWYTDQYDNLRENYEWRARSVSMVPSFTESEAEIRDLYNTDVESCWKEYRDKFIIGSLDLEKDWDEYVSTIDAFGLSEMVRCYQSVYDRTH